MLDPNLSGGVREKGILLLDEVDWLLHPLKSELNFPIGQLYPQDLGPLRWELPMHLMEPWLLGPGQGR